MSLVSYLMSVWYDKNKTNLLLLYIFIIPSLLGGSYGLGKVEPETIFLGVSCIIAHYRHMFHHRFKEFLSSFLKCYVLLVLYTFLDIYVKLQLSTWSS